MAKQWIEDDIGQQIPVEVAIPGGENIWAYYRKVSGKEYYSVGSERVAAEALFIINWRDDLDESMYILFKGAKYDIKYIDDFEGNKESLKVYTSIRK